jgi:thioesterase superfamily protein
MALAGPPVETACSMLPNRATMESAAARLVTRLNAWKQELDPAPQRAVLMSAAGGRATAQLQPKRTASPLSEPAEVLALGLETATAATLTTLDGATDSPPPVPLTIELQTNIFGPAGQDILTAHAEVAFRGRNSTVVNVTIRDERQRLVASMAVTQLAPTA